jgi:hypothetical protein
MVLKLTQFEVDGDKPSKFATAPVFIRAHFTEKGALQAIFQVLNRSD